MPQERILIVDNERSVLNTAADALRALGYVVVVAESAQDAMAIAGRETFDLVMAGDTLPDLNAAALVEQSRSLNPNASAVIMTDRSNAGTGFKPTSTASRLILAKPFDEDDLKATVSSGPRETRRHHRGSPSENPHAVVRSEQRPDVGGETRQAF